MAAGLTSGVTRLLDSPRARAVALVVPVGLLLFVGLSGPNAARPGLAPDGWAPGPLLPLTPSPAVVTATLWSAYLLGAAGVWLGMRQRPPALRTWWLPAGLGVLVLLTAPFGSADHISYLAYGRILDQGGDPWLESPAAWAGGTDPVTSRVEAPWTEEPSVYGPFGTLLQGLAAWAGGDSLRQGVWVWQLLVVAAWLAVRALLRSVLDGPAVGRVDVLWTTNPLVVGVGVLGAHIDVVAAALAVAAVAVFARWTGPAAALLAGLVAGLAGSTKVTYLVVVAGLLAAWWSARHAGRARWLRVPALLVGVVVGTLPLYRWAGPHVLDQLERSRDAVSLATPWRLVLQLVAPVLGGEQTRSLIGLGAAALAVLLAALLVRRSRPFAPPGASAASGPVALWVTACLGLAYSLAAPYSLPWYDVLVWAALPAALPGVLDLVALARTTVAACAYVPGRVLGMTPGVEAVTLGVRRLVAPWIAVALWAGVIVLGARRGSAPSSAPPPATGTPTPTR